MNLNKQETKPRRYSRRDMLAGSAALLMTGVVGGAMGAYAAVVPVNDGTSSDAPPLPWKWVKLDPLEAGQRAYRFYLEKGGCGTASYLSLLSLLKEKVGYPWTTLPDEMMAHAATGYAGNGTLCGALGGASCIINLVAYGPGKDALYRQMIDRLFGWYAQQEFPTDRFDDISPMPGQIRVRAMSPLCHTSVSKWAMAAGVEVTSAEKLQRCAKVAGEVVYTVVKSLNEYHSGIWIPAAWEPAKEVEHCLECHSKGGMNNQQGHMECLMCHSDHTK